jgi:copper(I)-binding protein
MHIGKTIAATMSAFILIAGVALAHGFEAGDIEVHHPYSDETKQGAPVAGGYMTIINHGKAADRLLSVTSPVSDNVMIHEMKMDGDVMKMRALMDGIEIPAGGEVKLKHGGLHIMFMSPKKTFDQGDMVKATLTFEKAGPLEIEFMVEPKDSGDAEPHVHKK